MPKASFFCWWVFIGKFLPIDFYRGQNDGIV
jgi:hypothetical protein